MQKNVKINLPPVTYNGWIYKADTNIAVNAKGETVKLEDQPPAMKYN